MVGLGICNRTVAVSKGYLTTVLVTVKVAPAKNPEIVSCCVFFCLLLLVLPVDSAIVMALALALAEEEGEKEVVAIVAKEAARNADRDMIVVSFLLLCVIVTGSDDSQGLLVSSSRTFRFGYISQSTTAVVCRKGHVGSHGRNLRTGTVLDSGANDALSTRDDNSNDIQPSDQQK